MELGFIGLGKMGMNMVTRLQQGKHRVVVYDRVADLIKQAEGVGCVGAPSLDDLVSTLKAPRAVWIMVPSGSPTDETVAKVASLLSSGDIIIDGGNTNFHDDVQRAAELKKKGLHYVDAGTSGGIWGLKLGYCLMVGGEKAIAEKLAPIFKTLAPEDGWAYMGGHGAGHYVKMVHNGIEYSMMQGYAEGFELMSKSEYNLDLGKIADLWMHGSVVRSWLLELSAGFLKENPRLDGLKGYVQDSGEGRWTVLDAIDKAVPLPTLTAALFTRFRSRQTDSFAEKMLAAMRNAFGGHTVKKG
ncbi:MAG TPA: decarboxylating 6-phosphogluconate dehydrogenase [Nitrospiraceae bacterium]|jgi:6-phosphogluconate dehydrogenase|nr:decarboxylating 6-phosphogluconate dehydrogenase [Nitrospiraceae bacterium]